LPFNTVDELARPRNDTFRVELPLIVSLGAAYTGIERLLLAADVRYLDFENAAGFGPQGFDATGAVRGLGFESIFAVALGAQHQLTDATSLRIGYSFNENPIPNSQSLFNVASPTIIMHTLYLGASYDISHVLKVSAGYVHGFENSIEGPIVTPLGAVPGSSVRSTTSVDGFMIGASMTL
jgi:long-chain fatty acid transport protein